MGVATGQPKKNPHTKNQIKGRNVKKKRFIQSTAPGEMTQNEGIDVKTELP